MKTKRFLRIWYPRVSRLRYMDKVKQTHGKLPWLILRYGCNLLSLLGIAQSYIGKLLRWEDILQAYDDLQVLEHKDEAVMNKICGVRWPGRVIQWGFETLGFYDIKARQIGGYDYERKKYSWWSDDKTVHATTLCARTLYDNEHYREGDRRWREIFNPNPNVKLVGEKKVLFYQITEGK